MIPTTLALSVWPLVGLALFRTLPYHAAIVATVVGGYLFLPTQGGFDLPLLPFIGKNLIATMTAAVLAMAFAPKAEGVALPGWIPRSPGILALIAILILGTFGTALTNGDTIRIDETVLPGLRPYDALSDSAQILAALLPFLIARKYFATPESHRTLLLVFAVAGLGYSLLALYEVRFSPRLNVHVYGFFPHDWRQHIRGGGFRPVVFLKHGLWLGIFFACATLAAFALWRIDRTRHRRLYLAGALWLLGTLFLCKALGALMIALAVIPLLLFLPVRLQIFAAAAIAGLITTYPTVRAAGLVPTDWIVEQVREMSSERAGSLQFRLDNEDILLAKAKERPLFGWGGWGRMRVYDERGRDISTTDGEWIITFSRGGWVRYIGEFGILSFAIFTLALRWRRFTLDPVTAALSLILAANMIDLIPNATTTPLTLLMAGALAGRLELARDSLRTAPIPEAGSGTRRAEPSGSGRPRGRPGTRPAVAFSRFEPKPGRNA